MMTGDDRVVESLAMILDLFREKRKGVRKF